MSLLESIHNSFITHRRARILARHVSGLLPDECTVLDVGCGDGYLASLIMQLNPGLSVTGVDVLSRETQWIPVAQYDGKRLPCKDNSVDVVLLVDVLHHLDDPLPLIHEAARVARRSVIIKDHDRDGFLAGPTLRLMDRVGNSRFGVALTYNYWKTSQWDEAFKMLGLKVKHRNARLGLYGFPIDLIFGRDLHFIAELVASPVGV